MSNDFVNGILKAWQCLHIFKYLKKFGKYIYFIFDASMDFSQQLN